jgi:hypothetical protein
MHHSSSPLARLLCAFVAAATIAGCQPFNWRGHGYGDRQEPFPRKLRPPADERQFSGLDARAREIERNLGVR